MKTLVMKFGGSTVGATTALMQVLSIVLHERENWDRLLLVASALEGVTDALIEAARLAQLGNQRGYRRLVANLRTRHLSLIEELPLGSSERAALEADLDRLLFDILDIYQNMSQLSETTAPDLVDATIGVGEKLSARIIAALVRQNDIRSVALDATSLIITDEVFGNANPNIPLTRQNIEANLLPLVERQIIPVVTGFIGATPAGKPTTLGRGGSDYSASVLGVCVNADEIWVWTDVDGMMTTDPHEIEEARVIPELSYDEVAELAHFGARILHARMIAPLREKQIPLRIKNIYKPQQPGTVIRSTTRGNSYPVKAVTSIPGLAILAERADAVSPIQKILSKTASLVNQNQIELVAVSQSPFNSLACFLALTTAGPDAAHSARLALEESLQEETHTTGWSVRPVTIVTIVGASLGHHLTERAGLFKGLDNIPVLALAHGASNCSVSIVVDSEYEERALHQLHNLIISNG
jgi:aspartate kinase